MKNKFALLFLLSLGIIILHLLPLWLKDSFGFDFLRYFSRKGALLSGAGFLILIF